MSLAPLFSKLGKDLKDLMKKKHEYKHHLTVVTKPETIVGLEEELVISAPNDKALVGTVRTSYKRPDFEVEMNAGTEGNCDVELKGTNLYPNTVVSAKTDLVTAKVGFEHRHNRVAVAATAHYHLENQSVAVEGSLVGEIEGFAIGGSGKYNVKDSSVDDYNLGLQYTRQKTSGTLITSDKAEKVSLMGYHEIANRDGKLKNTQLGAKLDSDVASFDNAVLSVGALHYICPRNLVSAKLDTRGMLSTVIEHRLENPSLTIMLASQFNVLKRSTPEKYGFGLKFDV